MDSNIYTLQACNKFENLNYPDHVCGAKSNDCEYVNISATYKALCESVTFQHMLKDSSTNDDNSAPIPVAIPPTILRETIKFCELLQTTGSKTDYLTRDSAVVDWQKEFIAPYRNDHQMLFKFISAASFLNIPQLMCLCVYTLARLLHGKNDEEMRAILGITGNNISVDELKRIDDENAWLRNLNEIETYYERDNV